MGYNRPPEVRDEPHPEPDRREDLEGAVFFVRDRAWGFEAPGREDHPGICVAFNPATRYCTFLKGTSTERPHHRATLILEPTAANGLTKQTAFELVPRTLPRRLVSLMYRSPRLIGRVDPLELNWIREELRRLFGRGGGPRWRH